MKSQVASFYESFGFPRLVIRKSKKWAKEDRPPRKKFEFYLDYLESQ